jgi:peptidoglycan/xylan/chitin deacetylase (PgdA/CDA1 family)
MPDTARPSPSIPILVYHQISEAPPKGAPFRGLYVSPGAFARQMALLKLLGYQGLCMSALLPHLKGERSGKVVGITFDDGYLNNLTHALPVLQRHGFSSTCYAVSNLLGRTNVWDQGIGIAQVPLMDAGQLREWLAGGQEVGSHTQNHVRLLQSDAMTARAEMVQDKAALEAMLATPVQHFCYPYGEYAPEHVVMAREAGFETVTTTRRGRSTIRGNLLELPRVPVVRSTSLPVFWLKIATAYEDRERA